MADDGKSGSDLLCPCGGPFLTSFSICCDVCNTWYHGKCAHVTPKQSGSIDKFVCACCHEQWPEQVTTYLTPKISPQPSYSTTKPRLKLSSTYKPPEHSQCAAETIQRCGECSGCYRTKDCNHCENCVSQNGRICLRRQCVTAAAKTPVPADWPVQDVKPDVLKQPKAEASNGGVLRESSRPKTKKWTKKSPLPVVCAPKKQKKHVTEVKIEIIRPPSASVSSEDVKPSIENLQKLPKRKSRTSTSDSEVGDKSKRTKSLICKREFDRHILDRYSILPCQGPECRRKSRPGSKYCSHQCGLERAHRNLRLVLPYRIAENKDGIKAFVESETVKMDRIVSECAQLGDKIDVLQRTRTEIIAYLDSLSSIDAVKPLPRGESSERSGSSASHDRNGSSSHESVTLRCPVCGYFYTEFSTLVRHTLKCYQKKEKEVVLISNEPELHNDDGFICDTCVTKPMFGYCKRIRALCYEHYLKFADQPERIVCGAPAVLYSPGIQVDIYNSMDEAYLKSEGFCASEKTACVEHFNWARELIGTLDNIRLELVNKHDHLVQKSRHIRDTLVGRCNMADLMASFHITSVIDGNGLPNGTSFSLSDDTRQKLDWTSEVAEINELIAANSVSSPFRNPLKPFQKKPLTISEASECSVDAST